MGRADTAEQRHGVRKGVPKRAHVVAGSAVLDRVVENPSAGARLRFGAPVALPGAFEVRFPGGAAHAARRR